MADYNEDHAAKLKHLYKVAVKQNEKAKALTKRVADLEAAGGQPNKIESVKVNGTAQAIGADKSVNITVPTKTSQLNNDSGYQTSTQVSDTVTKAVAAADHLKRKVVASAAAISTSAADAAQYIYMVPKGTGKDADKYDEYMVIDGVLEKVGGWEVDLTGYVKKETGKGLSTNDFTTEEKNKLAGLVLATDEEVDAMLKEIYGGDA